MSMLDRRGRKDQPAPVDRSAVPRPRSGDDAEQGDGRVPLAAPTARPLSAPSAQPVTTPRSTSRRDRRRAERRERRARHDAARRLVPTSTGPDEETVRLSTRDFRRHHRTMARRRRSGRFRAVLAGVLVLALVAAGLWALLFSSLLTVTGVDVSGNGRVGTARILRAAEVPEGRPLARVDLGAIQQRVEALPGVRGAEVSREWPHDVRIVVRERVPVAVIDQGQGLRALDASGVVFDHFASRPAGLPLVTSKPGTKADALAEGARVIGSLPSRIAARVDTIQVDSIDQITLDLRNGRQVVWGSSAQSAEKAEVLQVLLRRPSKVIDVSVPSSPTTR